MECGAPVLKKTKVGGFITPISLCISWYIVYIYMYVDVTNYIVHEGYKPSSIAFGGPRNGGLM